MPNDARMTVAHVVLTLNVGGLEHLVIQMSDEMERRGIRTKIVTLTDGVLLDEAKKRGLQTFALGKKPGVDVGTILRLRKIIRENHVDVVHTHNFAPLVHATLATVMTGARTLNTRHGPAPISTPRFIWRMNDFIVPVSEDSRRELVKFNNVQPEKVRVILNAIDLTPYSGPPPATNPLRKELGIGDGTLLIGNFSRLEPEKDHPTLLDAFRLLMDEGVDARLIIAGGGSVEAALKRKTEELGLSSTVHFLGFRHDIPQLLRSIDLYVVSSTLEGLSLSVLQAMAAGLPIVATRTGGNPEVVLDGQTGFIVECGRPAEMAGAMKRLLLDRDAARAFGRLARENAFRTFSLGRMVDSYVALYEQMLRRAPARQG
jgi:glycosyltransferase involved in cell wall biosynthesis